MLTSLYLSFSQEYQNFLISKQKKFLPHAGFEPGYLLNLSMHGTPYRISLVGIPQHVVTTMSTFSFIMLLLDRILTHIVNHLSNTSYHLQSLYCPGGYVFFRCKTQLDNMRCGIFLSEGLEDRLLSAFQKLETAWGG